MLSSLLSINWLSKIKESVNHVELNYIKQPISN